MNDNTHSANLVSRLIAQDSGISTDSLKAQRDRLEGSIIAMQGLSNTSRKTLMAAFMAVALCIGFGWISLTIEQGVRGLVSEASYAPMIVKNIILVCIVALGLLAARLFVISFRSWYILKPIHDSQRWQLQAAISRNLQEQIDAIKIRLNEVKS